MSAGKIIGGAVLGLLFMLFVALDLVLFGVVALNSALVTLLPVLGLLAGIGLGVLVGRRQSATDHAAG